MDEFSRSPAWCLECHVKNHFESHVIFFSSTLHAPRYTTEIVSLVVIIDLFIDYFYIYRLSVYRLKYRTIDCSTVLTLTALGFQGFTIYIFSCYRSDLNGWLVRSGSALLTAHRCTAEKHQAQIRRLCFVYLAFPQRRFELEGKAPSETVVIKLPVKGNYISLEKEF